MALEAGVPLRIRGRWRWRRELTQDISRQRRDAEVESDGT